MADRLAFTLPDFTRWAWVSDDARREWEPRIDRIRRTWTEVEWRSVARGIRSAGLTRLSPKELLTAAPRWANCGLSTLPLSIEGTSTLRYRSAPMPVEAGRPTVSAVAFGKLDAVAALRRAWDSSDHDTIGELLGYPRCCRSFFRDTWIDAKLVDTTWAMADRTAGSFVDTRQRQVTGPLEANVLWRWIGVRSVSHLPCRFDCAETGALGAKLRDVGRDEGFAQEMDWIEDILSWSIEWSALHGIAEVKTPVVKIITRTDSTATKHVVRRAGSGVPRAGAIGLGFPYRNPARLRVTDTPGFRRGLEHVVEITPRRPRPAWYHEDNGFSTRHAMDRAHRPIVDLARGALVGDDGAVLDLGCGNGVLVRRICDQQPALAPFGMDQRATPIEHARELDPEHAEHYVEGNLFDVDALPGPDRYALAVLMIGRLLEAAAPERERLTRALRTRCDHLLVYVYPGYAEQPFADLVAAAGLRLDSDAGSSTVGLIAVSSN